jgi:ectoine hydroxylase-related dioxygenase (phytanoyl-CoA dioxygenase family)
MLSTSSYNKFIENGFLRIPSFIPESLLHKLHALFDELMDTSVSVGKVVHENKGQKYVTSIEEICKKGNLAALELVGYPPILKLAEQICGADFFMIQEFAVIKHMGDELPVLWHLDMLHERKGQCFTMGIYLDDVEEGDGALKIVPGSHTSGKTICELAKESFVEVPAKAGDVLIHDMMVAHSSDPMLKNKLRRVIYFEFLSAAHVHKENIYADELIERRTKLTQIGAAYYAAMHPGEEKFIYQGNTNAITENLHEELEEIYRNQIGARPSTYCFEFNV